jgi:hypothetical protein
MKKEDLKAAFERIQPSPDAADRMWNRIVNHREPGKERAMKANRKFNRLVPVLGLAVLLAGSLLIYNMLSGGNLEKPPQGEIIQTDDLTGGREDAVAPVTDMFRLDDRHYSLLTEELREEFGFSAQINEGDLGDRIASIEVTPDESLKGLEVYRYIPAGGEAVVAVKRGGGYQLFRFFSFESYNNNQDEDASAYLKLYGIKGPQDIKAVRFIEYSEQSKLEGRLNVVGEITDPAEIAKFYDYYSVLKNASDKYFEKLFGYVPGSVDEGGITIDPAPDKGEASSSDSGPARDLGPAPDEGDWASPDIGEADILPEPADGYDAVDMPLPAPDGPAAGDNPSDPDSSVSSGSSGGMMDMGDAGKQGSSTSSGQGSAGNALENPVGVRIYNQEGVYYETMYYRNIGFLSRYEVSDEFADFLQTYISK